MFRQAWRVAYSSVPSFTVPSSCSIEKVTVYGSGLMGRGIAQVCAQAGLQVTLYDLRRDLLTSAYDAMGSSLSRIVQKQLSKKGESSTEQIQQRVQSILNRIQLSTDVQMSARQADLVVEAIVERVEVKQDLFRLIDRHAPKHSIFTSNTSSLSITDIASAVPTERQKLFAGLHFFNPVPVMKLVEVIYTPNTSAEQCLAPLVSLVQKLEKQHVLCRDTPGFIVNRLLVPYLIDAVRLVERGDALPADVDVAMRLGSGYPMGPLELLDYVGLDTVQLILRAWHQAHPDQIQFQPSQTIDRLVAAGQLGRKSGTGFYLYDKGQVKGVNPSAFVGKL